MTEEQIQGLKDGGVDLAWIETMSSTEEIEAAARAAIKVGIPYVFTASFDTAGRTMMGTSPGEMVELISSIPNKPIAFGANCGVRRLNDAERSLVLAYSAHGYGWQHVG